MAGQLRVDEITDEAGTGSPSFPNGLAGSNLTGTVAASLLTGNVAAARITDALNATGSAPIYACRAWVNFSGTSISGSGNVSSVTTSGTGYYRVNFSTSMPSANYAMGAAGQHSLAANISIGITATNVSYVDIESRDTGNNLRNLTIGTIMIAV